MVVLKKFHGKLIIAQYLKPDEKVLCLFGEGCIYGTDKLLQGSLERSYLFKGFGQKRKGPFLILIPQVIDRNNKTGSFVFNHVADKPRRLENKLKLSEVQILEAFKNIVVNQSEVEVVGQFRYMT